jgi:glycosyltransferase involved in cell wall biosynthesis
MKILFLTSGALTPSTRYRVLQYVPYLRASGHRCTVAHSFPPKYDRLPRPGGRLTDPLKRITRTWHLAQAMVRRYDVIYLERELFDADTWTMEGLFRRAARSMVLDVDDAIFLRYPEKFEHLVRISNVVIAGNRFLKERIEPMNPNVVIIPTCIDLARYEPKRTGLPSHSPVIIGWIGLASNLRYLQAAAPALRWLALRHVFELRIISEDDAPLRAIDLSGVRVRFVPWPPDQDVEALQQLDVGIMPLSMNQEWDVYKCGCKLIQYMGVALPVVASPVGVNAEIVRPGENGFLAATEEEWEQHLETLLLDPTLRERLGIAGRRRVKEDYSVAAHLPRLIATLQSAAEVTD